MIGYVDGNRLDSSDCGDPLPVRTDRLRHFDSNQLVLWYGDQDKVLLIISVFKCFSLYRDRLDVEHICCRLLFLDHFFKTLTVNGVEMTVNGRLLTRCLYWDRRYAIDGRCMSPYIHRVWIFIQKEVKYERGLSVMVHIYCRVLGDSTIAEVVVTPQIDLGCISYYFNSVSSIIRGRYCLNG